jgi:hypothetical protein
VLKGIAPIKKQDLQQGSEVARGMRRAAWKLGSEAEVKVTRKSHRGRIIEESIVSGGSLDVGLSLIYIS